MDKKTDWMVPGGSEVHGANGDFLNRKFKISRVQSFKGDWQRKIYHLSKYNGCFTGWNPTLRASASKKNDMTQSAPFSNINVFQEEVLEWFSGSIHDLLKAWNLI